MAISDYNKNELLMQIREFQKKKLLKNYSQMRKDELCELLGKAFHYRDIAGKTTKEMRQMCRDHNKNIRITGANKAKKEELVECIILKKIEMENLPEKIVGSEKTVNIIVANLMSKYRVSSEIAHEYFILRMRAQMALISTEQKKRKLELEKLLI